MKGWKTLAFNGAVAVGVAGLSWAAGVNWTEYVSPTTAVLIQSVVNIGLRMVTNTPAGKA
jgi:hypothetical protein